MSKKSYFLQSLHHPFGASTITRRQALSSKVGATHGRQILGCLASLIAMTAAVGLSGCQKISHTRVKMTATVETDAGTYTGSSVQEYACRHGTGIMSDGAECKVRGEAVVVDIKGRGYLFLIFDRPYARSTTSMAATVLRAVSSDPYSATNATLPNHWDLTPEQMPLMVKFRDVNTPVSVEEINPLNLEPGFGSGVKLTSVKIETTSERITFGPAKHILPWILDKTNHLYRDKNATQFSRTLAQSDFTSEYQK